MLTVIDFIPGLVGLVGVNHVMPASSPPRYGLGTYIRSHETSLVSVSVTPTGVPVSLSKPLFGV